MKKQFVLLAALLACAAGVPAIAAQGDTPAAPDLVGVHVERVVIDTAGLAAASQTLAGSVDRLALAIERLSTGDANLSETQKESVLAAVRSVDEAGQALAELSRQLPQSTRDLGDRLPAVIDAAREPVDLLNRGLGSARDSIYLITDALPEATENAKRLVNDTLDAALLRLSIYTFVLLAAVALALIAIVWFIYWQYLGPLARKLDELVGAPEHLDSMSRHMAQTSANLLQLRRTGRRGLVRVRSGGE